MEVGRKSEGQRERDFRLHEELAPLLSLSIPLQGFCAPELLFGRTATAGTLLPILL